MMTIVLRTKCVGAFSFRNAHRWKAQSIASSPSASRLLCASSQPEQPIRRNIEPLKQWDALEDEIGWGGAYDYEPDIVEMEEMMREEAQYDNSYSPMQQRPVPKVTQIQPPPLSQSPSTPVVRKSPFESSQSKAPFARSPPPIMRASPIIQTASPSPLPTNRPSLQPSQTSLQSLPRSPSFQNMSNLPIYDFFTFRLENENASFESSLPREETKLQQRTMSSSTDTKNYTVASESSNNYQDENPLLSSTTQPLPPPSPQPILIPNEPRDLLDIFRDMGAQMLLEDNNDNGNTANTTKAIHNIDTMTDTISWESKSAVIESPTPTVQTNPTPTLSRVIASKDSPRSNPFDQSPRVYTSSSSTPSSRPRPPPPPSAFLDPEKRALLAHASSGIVTSSPLHVLELELKQLTEQIYQQNNNEPFNINSLHQVSLAVFGIPGESTNKEALEAKASTGNRMADLILQYRRVQQLIRKQSSKQQAVEKGTRVKSAVQSIPSTSSSSSSPATSSDPLLLVDASAYIYRAYYSMPPIHRYDGMPTGAVMGFCNMLNRLVMNRMVQGEQPRIVLVFDAKGNTFRHELYKEYKAHRAEAPMDLIPQFSLIRQAGLAYGMPMIEARNYEADDVIATLAGMAQREGLDVHILSGDKDLMQLIRDDGPTIVHMIDPMKMERVTSTQVMEKWNVTPEQLGDVLALAGDSADNVPGVPGIGPKIAAELLREFGSLEYLLDHLDEVQQKARRSKLEANIEQARLSKALVTLVGDLPVEIMTFPEGQNQVSELRMEPMDENRILSFYDEMGFRDLKQRFTARLEGVKHTRRPAATAPRWSSGPKVQVPHPDDFRDVPF